MAFNGSKLKELRVKKGMNATQLSYDVFKVIGDRITRPSIERWEKGITIPRADKIAIISKYFNVTPDIFFD